MWLRIHIHTPDKGKIPSLIIWMKSGAGDPPKATQLGRGRGKTNEFPLRGPPRAARTPRSVSWVATQLRRHQDGCKERINHLSTPRLALIYASTHNSLSY